MKHQILMIDDDLHIHELFKDLISTTKYSKNIDFTSAYNGERGLEVLNSSPVDIAFVDQKLPQMSGMTVLKNLLKNGHTKTQLIMISGQNLISHAIEALKLGAQDFLVKPLNLEKTKQYIESSFEKNTSSTPKLPAHNNDLVGNSPPMQDLMKQIHKVALSDVSILLFGESGTGKELVAKAIHNVSGRKDKPFVAINCGAIPKELLESELFGHERGAFTGAVYKKIGFFQQAHGGTLFLDEIGDLDLDLQVKLLRVLQENEIQPVGSSKKIKIDVRIVSATHRNLQQYMEKKLFREDLFFRLNVFPILIPPLRERKEDIPLLAEYFLHKAYKQYRLLKKPPKLSKVAMNQLLEYPWKGNVRELKNLIQRLCLTFDHQDKILSIPDNMFQFKYHHHSAETLNSSSKQPIFTLAKMEEITIQHTLKHFKYNILRTSQALKIGRDTLYRKMKLYNIKNPIKR